jgi:hypothetical protein
MDQDDPVRVDGAQARHVVDRWFDMPDPSSAIFGDAPQFRSHGAPAEPEPDTIHAAD